MTLPAFDSRNFTVESVAASKRGRRVSVCLPACDEEASIGAVVACIRDELMMPTPVVDELVVVDDGAGLGRSDGTSLAAPLPWSSRLQRPSTAPVEVTMTEQPPLAGVPAYRARQVQSANQR